MWFWFVAWTHYFTSLKFAALSCIASSVAKDLCSIVTLYWRCLSVWHLLARCDYTQSLLFSSIIITYVYVLVFLYDGWLFGANSCLLYAAKEEWYFEQFHSDKVKGTQHHQANAGQFGRSLYTFSFTWGGNPFFNFHQCCSVEVFLYIIWCLCLMGTCLAAPLILQRTPSYKTEA